MMACTDTHCRTLHRLFSPNALLFTEMVTAGAVVYGPRQRLLRFQPAEAPVACQLGGSEPGLLAEAAQAAAGAGFAEINLNVGCPSPRVRRGAFGAALMAEPRRVADCVAAMAADVEVPVTVKCRLGLSCEGRTPRAPQAEALSCEGRTPRAPQAEGSHGRDSDAFLDEFIAAVSDAGCRTVYVHARIAVLDGLNPAQNRSIPPLQPERVHALKERFPELRIIANGGIDTLAGAAAYLARVDGVMIGRAAWREPRFLNRLDSMMFGTPMVSERDALDAYLGHVRSQLAEGERLADLVRPILGLFKGQPGARRYRQRLSCPKALRSNRIAVVQDAIDQVGFSGEAFSSSQCGTPRMPKEQTGCDAAVSDCLMKAPRDLAPRTIEKQRAA
ncbi:MAG: tRNA-dihydrouridine(20/20a) synthase DusA [Gammaproteobacteria bacterium]|nr:tRNA-dihydrouridine(20/20a) synthase DusA [Gammaproteobacteria bacterium]